MLESLIEYLMGSFFNFYGTDWLALIFISLGSYHIAKKNRIGCLYMGIGCVSGFMAALISGQVGFLFGNAFQIMMMSYGFLTWHKCNEKAEEHKANHKITERSYDVNEPRTYP